MLPRSAKARMGIVSVVEWPFSCTVKEGHGNPFLFPDTPVLFLYPGDGKLSLSVDLCLHCVEMKSMYNNLRGGSSRNAN